MDRFNPLPPRKGRRRRRRGSPRPRTLRRAQEMYKEVATDMGREIQKAIWKWMQEYGLNWTSGHTFMDQSTYAKQLYDNLDREDITGRNIALKDVSEFPRDFGLDAPIFILTSGKEKDDLHSILTMTYESRFFENMRKRYFKDDPDADEKLELIADKLGLEFHRMLARKGWEVGEKVPGKLRVYLRTKYPHRNYNVFPLYLKRSRSRRQLKSLIPYYRRNADTLLRQLEKDYYATPTEDLRIRANRERRRHGMGPIDAKKILVINDNVDPHSQIPDSLSAYFEVIEWSFSDERCKQLLPCTAEDVHELAPDLIIILYPSTYERRMYRDILVSGHPPDAYHVARFMAKTSRYSNWMGSSTIEGLRPIPIIGGLSWGNWIWRNGEASPDLHNIDWYWEYPEAGSLESQ